MFSEHQVQITYIEFVRKLYTSGGQQLLATRSVLPIFQFSAKSSFVMASLEELSAAPWLQNIPRKALPLTKTLPPLPSPTAYTPAAARASGEQEPFLC